jgi:hypothetical protein
METYEQIIAEITDKIKTNGNKEITGAILQGVLLGIIAAVQANQEEKLEYYSEDKEDGSVKLSGELLDLVRIVAGNGLTIDTNNFKFRLQHGGLEIVDNATVRHLRFDNYGLGTNMNIETEGEVHALSGLVLMDGYNHKYIVTVNQNRELIVEPYDE